MSYNCAAVLPCRAPPDPCVEDRGIRVCKDKGQLSFRSFGLLTFHQTKQVVLQAIRGHFRYPIYLEGGPGIGKSAIVSAAAAELKAPVWVFRPAYLSRTDLVGAVVPVDGKPQLVQIEDLLPFDKEVKLGVLLIEELPQADVDVHGCLLELLLERAIRGKKLPDGWRMVAIGNRREDNAGAGDLLTTVRSRMLTIRVKPDLDEWLDWARSSRLSPIVTTFLVQYPDEFYRFTGEETEAFPCPRGWEIAAEGIRAVGDLPLTSQKMEILTGSVGHEAATKVLGFWNLIGKLPDGSEVWAGRAELPDDPAVQYAAVASLVGVADKMSVKEVNEGLKGVLKQLPEELQAVLVKELTSRRSELASKSAFLEFFARMAEPIRKAFSK